MILDYAIRHIFYLLYLVMIMKFHDEAQDGKVQ